MDSSTILASTIVFAVICLIIWGQLYRKEEEKSYGKVEKLSSPQDNIVFLKECESMDDFDAKADRIQEIRNSKPLTPALELEKKALVKSCIDYLNKTNKSKID